MTDLRSPLSKVRGLGAAGSGTGHFWSQRWTALLLIPLVLWLGFCLASMPIDHASLIEWIRQPLVTIALVLTIIVLFYHAQLGLQVVIEDYVHGHGLKIASLVISRFAHVFLAVVGVFAVLKLGIGA